MWLCSELAMNNLLWDFTVLVSEVQMDTQQVVHCGLQTWGKLYTAHFYIFALLSVSHKRVFRSIIVKDCTPVNLNISPVILFTFSYQTFFFVTEQTKFSLVRFLCCFIYHERQKGWDGNPRAQNPESRIWSPETSNQKLKKLIKLEYISWNWEWQRK